MPCQLPGKRSSGHKKSLKETWISDCTWALIAERKLLHQRRFSPSDGEDAYQEYIKMDKAVKSSAQRDKREWLDRQAEEAEEPASRNDIHTVYQITKKICGAVKTGSGSVKAKDGMLLSRGEDKLARWTEHFKEVLKTGTSMPCHCGKPTSGTSH
ncbi:craniofacial development 2-like protein [Labeo rohita]|uniref:Craniofacial development 2-like protein n=1 Tax=Labeo rohita TaxID=84645 RepID=A0A498MJI2_LABRO|nr:craniofacial development 2-like protein [Labeo rohita]